MTPQTDSTCSGRGLNYVPYISAALALSLLFLGWVGLTHRPDSQQLRDTTSTVAAQKNAQTVEYYGNGQLKVLSFYAEPSEVRPGARALVCYGVSNAASVSVEPQLGEVWPSTGRCMEASATKDTEYRLTARDTAGHEQVRTVTLRVKR
jgi:hypothetical protein